MGKKNTFNAFNGVFVPTFLSIVGVILFLRTGYVTGEGGVLGAVSIILLSVSVTVATALSLSSITTNIRIGEGGAYSIISQTLGLEVGGSVGIPLYLAQIFSVLLYIFGFAEAWKFLFPGHSRWIVLASVFTVLFFLTFLSTELAVKAQVFVFIFVVLALVSVFFGGGWWNTIGVSNLPSLSFPSSGQFWNLFALFFPAVTGLMAGIGMSGELSDPKSQIPKGVLSAIGVSTLLYILVVFWFFYTSSFEAMASNTLLIAENSRFPVLVFVGILAATFSSALTTFMSSTRVMQALAGNSVLPFSDFISRKSEGDEPRNAIIVSSLFISMFLFFGNLDSIAPVLTMFFLITYSMINLSVFIEQSLDLVSYRPTFRVPVIIPLYGLLGSVLFMFYINIIASMLALALLFFSYLFMLSKHLEPGEGESKSGVLYGISEWAARKVLSLPESTKHVWKPNLLVPVSSTSRLLGNFPIVKSILYPEGVLSALGVLVKDGEYPGLNIDNDKVEDELSVVPGVLEKFENNDIFTNYARISADDYINDVCVSIEAMEGQFLHPNILFFPFDPRVLSDEDLDNLFSSSVSSGSGLTFSVRDNSIGLGSESDVHVWLPSDVLDNDFYEDRSFDLGLLIGYRISKNWDGNIHLWMCVSDERKGEARDYVNRLAYEGRLQNSVVRISDDSFEETLANGPTGDIHIIPVISKEDMSEKLDCIEGIDRTFLFVKDSGEEDFLS